MMPTILCIILFLLIPSVYCEAGSHLCGNELVQMLELVCGGLYFGFGRSKRSVQRLHVLNDLESTERDERDLVDLKSIITAKRGGVADECCVKSCSFETLQNYCLHDQPKENDLFGYLMADQPTQDDDEEPKTVPVTSPPTFQNTKPTTTPPRSGGVRSRQRNRWFFFQSVGHNPTRRPF